MASESTKLQVNFKTPGGTLINLYADTEAQLDAELASLQARVGNIVATEQLLSGANTVAQSLPVQPAPVAPAQPAAAPAAPAPAAPAAPVVPPPAAGELAINQCVHGARVHKTGTGKNGRPWAGWLCPTPKGAPDKCSPNWVDA